MSKHKSHLVGIIQLVLVVAVITGAVATSLWLASLRKEAEQVIDPAERTLVVTSATVEPVPYRISFDATANVDTRSPVSMVPQVSGKIVEISDNLFPGGVFKKGEVLFRIEKDDYRHETQRLEAELARARTVLELQKAESQAAVKEWKSMNKDREAPSLVAQEPQLMEARAAVRAAQAQLGTARLNLRRTDFSLPFDGRVTEANIELGQFVTAGQQLGAAYALDGIEIRMPVNDRQYGWIREALKPDITVSSSYLGKDISFKARVKRRGAEFDRQTRFTNVILSPDYKQAELLPGLFVDVQVIGPMREQVWLLPISALQEDNTVWKITDQSRLEPFEPQIINITRDYVAAYSNGQTINVVTGPLPQATKGTKVRVRNHKSAQ